MEETLIGNVGGWKTRWNMLANTLRTSAAVSLTTGCLHHAGVQPY